MPEKSKIAIFYCEKIPPPEEVDEVFDEQTAEIRDCLKIGQSIIFLNGVTKDLAIKIYEIVANENSTVN